MKNHEEKKVKEKVDVKARFKEGWAEPRTRMLVIAFFVIVAFVVVRMVVKF